MNMKGWRSPDYWMGEPIPGTGSLAPSPLRCVGGPMHGRVYAIGDLHTLEVPCMNLDQNMFVGNNPSEFVAYTVVRYVRRHFQQTTRSANREYFRRERVLVPDGMPQNEAERLWLTLPPL